jgi:hypothetical protein
LEPTKYESLRSCIEKRLNKLIQKAWNNKDARRLVKRLVKYRASLFVFLYHREVPPDNNFAERQIRGVVVMRKNSYCNWSEQGAQTQVILRSILL